MRILALDIGDRRIGVALSDPNGILASPFTIIERRDDQADVQGILAIVREQGAERIIAGLPRSMDGSIGRQAEKVQAFAEILRQQSRALVEFRDERLSTVSAKRLMQVTRKGKQKVRDDAAAAAVVLQAYLDEQRQTSWSDDSNES